MAEAVLFLRRQTAACAALGCPGVSVDPEPERVCSVDASLESLWRREFAQTALLPDGEPSRVVQVASA